jgi:hypothetical protein
MQLQCILDKSVLKLNKTLEIQTSVNHDTSADDTIKKIKVNTKRKKSKSKNKEILSSRVNDRSDIDCSSINIYAPPEKSSRKKDIDLLENYTDDNKKIGRVKYKNLNKKGGYSKNGHFTLK